jgi:crossover junction endodeoxyribonuclease RuvC
VGRERPTGVVASRREGPRNRPGGTAACGYAIVQGSAGRLKAVEFDWWKTPAGERPELRLRTIFEGVAELIARHEPDAVAIEESFVGADARTALSVGQARGVVLVAAALAGVECAEYAPARVKQAVCGYGARREGAGAAHGRGDPRAAGAPTAEHAADALAVAICHALAPPLLRASA